MKRLVAVIALALVVPALTPAAAQWSTLPDGELGYTFDFTPFVTFACGRADEGPIDGTCTSDGNSISFTSGDASLSVFFHPTTSTLTATNETQFFTLGSIETVLSGTGPFMWPQMMHPWREVLFRLTGTFNAGFISHGGSTISRNCCGDYPSNVFFRGLLDSPPPSTYTLIAFDHITVPDLSAVSGSVDVTGAYGLIPEPSTFVLTGTGVLALIITAGCRRRGTIV